MNISENIQWIISKPTLWKFYTNKSYRAKIQIADSQRVYNVKDNPGVVYNYLEDSYERVCDSGYIVTGIAGEMWPIPEKVIRKYNVDPPSITAIPMEVDTIELDTVLAAVMIPIDIQFTLEVDYGKKALLKGNRSHIEHGDGDYVLVAAKMVDGAYYPDFDDCGRIINGKVFSKLYKPFDKISPL